MVVSPSSQPSNPFEAESTNPFENDMEDSNTPVDETKVLINLTVIKNDLFECHKMPFISFENKKITVLFYIVINLFY